MSLEDFTNMDLTNLNHGQKTRVRQVINNVFGDYTPNTDTEKVDWLKDVRENKPQLWKKLQSIHNSETNNLHLSALIDTDWDKLQRDAHNTTNPITVQKFATYQEALRNVFEAPVMQFSPIKQWFANAKARPVQSAIPTPIMGKQQSLAKLPSMFSEVHAANLTDAERQFQQMFADWSDPKNKDVKLSNERRVDTSRIVGLVIPEVRKDGRLITPERTLHVNSYEFATALRRMIKDPSLLTNAKFLSEQGVKVFRIGGGKLFGPRTGTITTVYDPATKHMIGDVQSRLRNSSPQFAAELLSGGRQSAKADIEFTSKTLPLDPNSVRIKNVAGKNGMPLLMIPLFALMNGILQGTGEGLTGESDANKEWYAQFTDKVKQPRVVPPTLR
jgi:hypothetical protein